MQTISCHTRCDDASKWNVDGCLTDDKLAETIVILQDAIALGVALYENSPIKGCIRQEFKKYVTPHDWNCDYWTSGADQLSFEYCTREMRSTLVSDCGWSGDQAGPSNCSDAQ